MRLTEKGQVTIPLAVRKALGLSYASEVEFTVEGTRAYLTKKTDVEAVAERLAAYKGRADLGLGTDEILALTRG
jgi:AbrB family looped-hinge helix DNA binding protein